MEKTIDISRTLFLHFIDQTWSQYLEEMDDIREGIHLVRLGQENPLLAFNRRIIPLAETDPELFIPSKNLKAPAKGPVKDREIH